MESIDLDRLGEPLTVSDVGPFKGTRYVQNGTSGYYAGDIVAYVDSNIPYKQVRRVFADMHDTYVEYVDGGWDEISYLYIFDTTHRIKDV